jgi:hypothetical protein
MADAELVSVSNLSVGQRAMVKTAHEAELDEDVNLLVERTRGHIFETPKR